MRYLLTLGALCTLAACGPAERPGALRAYELSPTTPQNQAQHQSAAALGAERPASSVALPAPAVLPPNADLRNEVADASVTVDVKTALGRDRELQAVEADSVNGRVVLRGEVPTPWARERAARVAGSIDGVRLVYNDLRVEAQNLH
ncbi:BON domain-containing protein [Caldimonas sp. KR1-144]|uniref:BON domain-containing protein n=1 Tax=Caldimonas sp. KR1-144 TaxID=3400911 RepID=UPI003C0790EF